MFVTGRAGRRNSAAVEETLTYIDICETVTHIGLNSTGSICCGHVQQIEQMDFEPSATYQSVASCCVHYRDGYRTETETERTELESPFLKRTELELFFTKLTKTRTEPSPNNEGFFPSLVYSLPDDYLALSPEISLFAQLSGSYFALHLTPLLAPVTR